MRPVLKRWTSRVLLVDEHDRLLLLCGRDPRAPGARWWFTVGGGVEAGEDHVSAAVREVREETAFALPARRLGPVVWTMHTLFTVDGQRVDQQEEYRLARVTRAEGDTMRFETDESRYGQRWWTAEALATTDETIRPTNLAVLLTDLLHGSTPAEGPRHLGSHDEDAPAARRRPTVTP